MHLSLFSIGLSICSADLLFHIFKFIPSRSESLTIASIFVYMHHVLGPSLLLMRILPMQSNKSVKAPVIGDAWKNAVLGVGLMSNTALGFVLCCICHPTPSLILYFSYIICNSALTYTCIILINFIV